MSTQENWNVSKRVETRLWLPFVIVGGLFFIICSRTDTSAPDFSAYVKATKLFFQGKDPYEASFSENNLYRFYSPPSVFAVLYPLRWLDSSQASETFIAIYFISIFFAVLLLYDLYLRDLALSRRASIAVACLLSFQGVIFHGYIWGTLSWIPLLGLTAFIWTWSKGYRNISGFIVFLWLFRLQHEFLIVAYLIFFLFRKRAYSTICMAVATVIFSLLAVVVANPQAIRTFNEGPQFQFATSFTAVSLTSILMVMSKISLTKVVAASILTQVFCMAFLRKIFLLEPESAMPLLIPFSILFGPYAWFHDYLICLPLLFVAVRMATLKYRAGQISEARCLWIVLGFMNATVLVYSILAEAGEIYAAFYLTPLLSILLLAAYCVRSVSIQQL